MAQAQNPGTAHHLPEPSVWPLVAGGATFLAAAALVWWSRERSGELMGVFLGAAAMALLVTIGGWAMQDGKMRRQTAAADRTPGVNQVIEFLLVPGASSTAALISDIERLGRELQATTDLEDVRILQSNRAGQPLVMIEASWPSVDALHASDTRQSFLDVIGEHAVAIQPGSVQAFDLETLVETKDLAPRFNSVAAATIVGALVLGAVTGAFGLALFEQSGTGGGVGPGPGATPTPAGDFEGVIVSRQVEFLQTEFSLPPNTEVTLVMDNQDNGVPHNIAFYTSESAGEGDFLGGCIAGCDDDGAELRTKVQNGLVTQTFTFTTPAVGRYGYLCEVHPTTMRGVMDIADGAPVPAVPAP